MAALFKETVVLSRIYSESNFRITNELYED